MRPWQVANWRALLVIYSSLILLVSLGCGGDDQQSSTAAGGSGGASSSASTTPVSKEKLIVHYYRPLNDYDGWTLGVTGDTTENDSLKNTQPDSFGARYEVPLTASPHQVSLSIKNGQTQQPSAALSVDLQKDGKEIWIFSESSRVYSSAPAIPEAGTAIVYYRRNDGEYSGYGLHVWQDTTEPTEWTKPLPQAGADKYGAYFKVHLTPGAKQLNFIIHNGDIKDPGSDQSLKPAEKGLRIWVLSGDTNLYTYPAEAPLIDATRAHWVAADTIAWNLIGDDTALGNNVYQLRYDPTGALTAGNGKLEGGKALDLTFDKAGLSDAIKAKFPHLSSYKALKLKSGDLSLVPEILKGQILISTAKAGGTPIGATGVQIPGVLDELFTYKGELGVVWKGNVPTLNLWAPTARSVKVHLYGDPTTPTEAKVADMTVKDGVFSVTGDASWRGQYYLYEVEVFVHSTGKIEHNMVTDPYSLSLSANSQRSQIVDLADPTLFPTGWVAIKKPALVDPSDISLYELHVRDFSISDTTVPAAHRGTFLAFTDDSNGMQHLTSLAAAGLSHVHLLPAFDFATVEEVKSKQQTTGDLAGYAADSEQQQAETEKVKDTDGFNWGYDPLHYTVPEGSYATNPDGTQRIIEFRQMVKGLNNAGLRVIMDVVYNHTHASGQDPKAVLDRVVPGYYHRLNLTGGVETSTCCANTASEHAMMEKLMVDSLVTWARAYKVDGFRFDLMGHHMKSNILKARAALDALTLATDGVDGKSIYLYGEGWDFGEVAGNARGENATQFNMAGTGVGTFNDRLRDAVRGGGPFDGGPDLQKQGFVSGLFYEPNAFDQGSADAQKAALLLSMDLIRVGLTGNLKDYTFIDRTGAKVKGSEVKYNNYNAGYTSSPVEGITYAEAHDNQTLFDILQYKAKADTTMEDRVRMQNLAVDILALGQGVPFFHAGVELLRSKSLDRDSFNSGDWFNKLDFTYASNNWGVGLPPAQANMDNWSLMKPLLADPARKPEQKHILVALEHFKAMLSIRKSTKLLRLGNAVDVGARLRFHNTGPDQTPGLIVMSISDEVAGLPDLDPALDAVVVLINATQAEVTFSDPIVAPATLSLHPIQLALTDDPVTSATFTGGKFTLPARTTAVFVGAGLLP